MSWCRARRCCCPPAQCRSPTLLAPRRCAKPQIPAARRWRLLALLVRVRPAVRRAPCTRMPISTGPPSPYAKPVLGHSRGRRRVFRSQALFRLRTRQRADLSAVGGRDHGVLMAERPTPQSVFRRLTERQPTIFYGVPTLYAAMLSAPDLPARGHVALRRCTSAGRGAAARSRGDDSPRILAATCSTASARPKCCTSSCPIGPARCATGRRAWQCPATTMELRGENGLPVGDDSIGELFIRGPSAALMYWGNREKTRTTFQGEWTKSGDKYSRSADGYYTYAGRSDDMMKVAGQYVSPFEVEAALMRHDAVLEAAVVGKADADGLTRTLAYVVLKPGQTGERCAGRMRSRRSSRTSWRRSSIRARYASSPNCPRPPPARSSGSGLREAAARMNESLRRRDRSPSVRRGRVRVAADGREFELEVEFVGDDRAPPPLVVFLHEGLGSRARWRDYPRDFCAAAGVARAGVFATGLWPLDGAARRTSAGRWTTCIARPRRCCRRCSPRLASNHPCGCSGTATAHPSHCCTRPPFPTGRRVWSPSHRMSWSRT